MEMQKMTTVHISRLQIFEEKKAPGRRMESVQVVKDGGIKGDLHCLDGKKQISIMTEEVCRFLETEEVKGLCFQRFKANLVLDGQIELEVGDRIRAGGTLLLVTGKKGPCFEECRRYQRGMDCMLKEGCWFATSLEDGVIHQGDLLEKPGRWEEESSSAAAEESTNQTYDWERYTRQMMVPGMGSKTQERLKEAAVLVVGAGGLGCPILTILAEAGIGRLGVMDGDTVERTNLNRQFLYAPEDIGKKKAVCAGAWLRHFRPDMKVQVWEERLSEENGMEILSSFDLIICAVDKVQTRMIINRLAARCRKPLIDGAIDGYYGTVTAVTKEEDPCLACMNPDGKEPEHVSSSLGTTTMILGALEAQFAISFLTGQERKGGSMLSYDGVYGSVEEILAVKNPTCPVCSRVER